MKKLFLSLFICFFCTTFSFAQSDEPEYVDFQNRAIGINVPFYPSDIENFIHYGGIEPFFIFLKSSINYQQYFNNNWGFQIELGLSNFALELRKLFLIENIGNTSNFSLFAYSNAICYLGFFTKWDYNFAISTGIGMEPAFFGHLSLPIKLGFCITFPYENTCGLYANLGLAYRF